MINQNKNRFFRSFRNPNGMVPAKRDVGVRTDSELRAGGASARGKIYFCFGFLIVACLLFFAIPVLAQVRLETGLPNIPGQLPAGQELPSYINYLFIFGLGLITFLALGYMMLGGVQYILAAGNVAKVESAKETIQQALIGLGLLLVSYLLLRTINPDLVNLRNPNLAPILFKGEAPPPLGPTGPNEPPQSGRPSVFIYGVTSPQACASTGGQIFSPCETYCRATPGLCSASNICCGRKP